LLSAPIISFSRRHCLPEVGGASAGAGFTVAESEDLHDVIEIATQTEIATTSSAATRKERVARAGVILFTGSFRRMIVR
jgi:hypothetical protein